jgi:hypothetical protein
MNVYKIRREVIYIDDSTNASIESVMCGENIVVLAPDSLTASKIICRDDDYYISTNSPYRHQDDTQCQILYLYKDKDNNDEGYNRTECTVTFICAAQLPKNKIPAIQIIHYNRDTIF